VEVPGYSVEGELGRGGMGVVYRATHLRLQRTVALKVLAPELSRDTAFRSRFDEEARVAASIEHPNVIPIYDAGDAGGLLYLAMRYVEGTDLSAAIAAGPIDGRRAARLIDEIGGALDAAHARGLVHRDVKPANILLDAEGKAYLTDFGLTKLVDASGLTQTGQIVGTPHYMAPEQVEGRRVDARADVYSLGCTLYHALVGRVPFARTTTPAVMYAHVHEPPPIASAEQPALSGAWDAVIQRAMAKDPDARYPSAGDLGRAVLAAAGAVDTIPAERSVARGEAAPAPATHPAPAVPTEVGPTRQLTSPPPAPPRRSGRGALVAAVAAVVVAAGVAAALLLAGGGDDTSTTTTTGASTSRPTVATVTETTTTPKETTVDKPAPKAGDWPAGRDGWAVVVASKKNRAEAQAAADRAAALGPAGVLRSSDYSSLRPGYWVAFVGPLQGPKVASRAAAALRKNGFAGAYPRMIAD
jgi:predicted Ser/Thr protein kinase